MIVRLTSDHITKALLEVLQNRTKYNKTKQDAKQTKHPYYNSKSTTREQRIGKRNKSKNEIIKKRNDRKIIEIYKKGIKRNTKGRDIIKKIKVREGKL